MSLPRVLALVGGLGLIAAFFMPWFASQGLLLSGQFLHNFLSGASPAQLRQFLPSTSPSEVQALRVLVDLFPVAGAIAVLLSLVAGLAARPPLAVDVLLLLSGFVPLLAWAIGITRLPGGSMPEIGLYLIAAGAIAVAVGTLLARVVDLRPSRLSRE